MSTDCSDGEPLEFDITTYRRAQKAHRCCACRSTIRSGEVYAYERLKADGLHIFKRCGSCEVQYLTLCDMALKREGGFGPDDWPDRELNCGHDWADLHGELQPPTQVLEAVFWSPAQRSEELERLKKAGPRIQLQARTDDEVS